MNRTGGKWEDWASIRTSTYKYTEYYQADRTTVKYREYYDLQSDGRGSSTISWEIGSIQRSRRDKLESAVSPRPGMPGTEGPAACP